MKMLSFGFKIIPVFLLISTSIMTGCIDDKKTEVIKENSFSEKWIDEPSILPESILPDWKEGLYHDYNATKEKLIELNNRYPNLTSIFSIGKSVQGRDIMCIRISNNGRYSCLIDGCIHGNEWEATESCLYLADYLLMNFGRNKTVTNILNTSEIYIVPLFNPDGRENDDRFNANGIDLNRNFDVYFGRILGRSFPLGKLFGIIKIPGIKIPGTKIIFTNAGRYPFSEPETRAMRGLMEYLSFRNFSFYINCHTAVHCILGPSDKVYFPEYTITSREKNVIDDVKNWVANNTEYEAYYTKKKGFGGGTAVNWCFKAFHIPSFTFEILSKDYEPMLGHGKHDHLVHWMKTTLPVFLYLLVNIKNLYSWSTPDIQPVLPEGVPPIPLSFLRE